MFNIDQFTTSEYGQMEDNECNYKGDVFLRLNDKCIPYYGVTPGPG